MGLLSQAGLSAVRFFGAPPAAGTLYTSKLVDHDSDLPAMRAANTTVWPSGLKWYSSASPNGFEGTSPSRVPDRATGAPALPAASMGAEYSTLLRWSFQVSQWRTNRRS